MTMHSIVGKYPNINLIFCVIKILIHMLLTCNFVHRLVFKAALFRAYFH